MYDDFEDSELDEVEEDEDLGADDKKKPLGTDDNDEGHDDEFGGDDTAEEF